MFFLSVLNLAYVLDPNITPIPNTTEDTTKEEKERIAQLKKKHDEDTFVLQDHILNTLSDRLYHFYI